MGKPRLIILVRHAQSEGNANRSIHQHIPDHRVRLTSLGEQQALAAGERLAGMLTPEDTVQIITSPYTRTRETTQGILASSLKDHPNAGKIKVYEEPRLREQDFGNFQPCSEEMTRMWHERAAYGHFFYRIPNGESAADAYDRVSGFNETLWRQFQDDDFPSVLVLVTHGLMTRIFLMKWYHYSVEYFEDLRNVNHCEFVVMEKTAETEKYTLNTKLRTWTGYAECALQKEHERYLCPPLRSFPDRESEVELGVPEGVYSYVDKAWGGCPNGCDHAKPKEIKAARRVSQDGRDFGGSRSGAPSRQGSESDEADYWEEGEGDERRSVGSLSDEWENFKMDEKNKKEEEIIKKAVETRKERGRGERLGDVGGNGSA